MTIRIAKILSWTLVATLCLSALGCGSSSNNDQGVAFTLFGFFKSPCGDSTSGGDAGTVIPIDQDFESDQGVNIAAYETCYGLQNNLAREGIRVEAAFMDYFIPGAAKQPPSTSQPLGVVLGPSGTADDSDLPQGSLPPGFDFENETRIGVFILPPDVIGWLSLNRASLPELPFLMRVNTYVTGVTTSGNRLETNRLSFPIDFVVGNEIVPSGEGNGGAAGGAGSDVIAEVPPSGDVSGDGGDVPVSDGGAEL